MRDRRSQCHQGRTSVAKQVREDTCSDHGVFCCPQCFNMEVIMTTGKANRIEATEELLKTLCNAQADHTADILRNHDFGDDGGDYTNSALDVMTALFNMYWDQVDLVALDLYLNTSPGEVQDPYGMMDFPQSGGKTPHLWYCASDGVCSALWDLHCIALEDNEEAA